LYKNWPGRRVETRLPILDIDCRIVTYPNPEIKSRDFPSGYNHLRLAKIEGLLTLLFTHLAPMNKCLLRIRNVTIRAHVAPHRVPWGRLPLGVEPDQFCHDGRPMANIGGYAFGVSNPMHSWPGEFGITAESGVNVALEEALHTIHAMAFSRRQHHYIEQLFDERVKSRGPWQSDYSASSLDEFFAGLAMDYLRFTRARKETDDGQALMTELFPKWSKQLEGPDRWRVNWPLPPTDRQRTAIPLPASWEQEVQ
jgi:hypothetical protein